MNELTNTLEESGCIPHISSMEWTSRFDKSHSSIPTFWVLETKTMFPSLPCKQDTMYSWELLIGCNHQRVELGAKFDDSQTYSFDPVSLSSVEASVAMAAP
jgi:hypothetical protein